MVSSSFISLTLAALILPLPSTSEVVVDPVPGAERPERISSLPIYSDFYDQREQYNRAHIHLVGLQGKNSLGWRWKLNSPEAYVTVETYGEDTGSVDYFPIGKHEFDIVESTDDTDNYLFEWDTKQLLLYKTAGTAGISFTVFDDDKLSSDDILMQFKVPFDAFPAVGEGYKEFRMQSEVESAYSETSRADLVFKMKITKMSEPIVTEEKLLSMTHAFDTEAYPGIEYDEHVLELTETGGTHDYQDGNDRAIVQSWRHVNSTDVEGAVLWVIGRNDAFTHAHVAEKLFFGPNSSHKLDLYVLNWRLNGLAIHRGFVTDSRYISHNAYGDFNVYTEEVTKTLTLLKDQLGPSAGGDYAKLIAYGHSTGAPILANYIRMKGASEFDGIALNSPFLDWAESSVNEFALETVTDVLTGIGVWENDDIVNSKDTPDAYADDPVIYLGAEVVMSAWAARAVSNYPRPWSWRNMHSGFVTAGFANGASNLFEDFKDDGPVAPSTPMLVVSSEADSVLDGKEAATLVQDYLSESAEIYLFRYNSHDMFLSLDEEDVDDVIDVFENWLGTVLSCESDDDTCGLGDGSITCMGGTEGTKSCGAPGGVGTLGDTEPNGNDTEPNGNDMSSANQSFAWGRWSHVVAAIMMISSGVFGMLL